MATGSSDLFSKTKYQIQHELGLLKEKFKVEDESGTVIMWVSTPSFSMKKEFHLYADEDGKQEVLQVKIHKLIEFADTWDVREPGSQTSLGTIKFEALKSFMGSKWQIINPQGQQIAEVAESTKEHLENTVAGGMVPRKYAVVVDGATVGTYDQTFLSLKMHFVMDFSADTSDKLDRRLEVATGIVVAHKALTEKKDEHGPSISNLGI